MALSVTSSFSRPAGRPGLHQHPGHRVGQLGLEQVAHRDVDGHQDRGAGVAPGHALPHRRLEDEPGQRLDQAGVLGQRDELVGRDVAPQRVVPAQQRLDAGHLAAAGVRLRLVVQLEGPLLDGPRQVADQRQPARAVRVAVGGVARHPGQAALGVVHRDLGAAQQQRRRRPVPGSGGDADRGHHVEGDLAQVERPRHVAGDPGDHALDVHVVAAEQDGELVAAEPGDDGLAALDLTKPPAHLAQQPVTHVVAEGVVDLLEAVDVHQQHRRRPVGEQPPLEPLLEVQAVRQAGQRVVQREVLGLLRRSAHPRDQARVGQGHAGVPGQRLEQLEVVAVERAHVVEPVAHQEHAGDLPAVAQRRGQAVGPALGAQQVVLGALAAAGQQHRFPLAGCGPPGDGIGLAEHHRRAAGPQQLAGLGADRLHHRLARPGRGRPSG